MKILMGSVNCLIALLLILSKLEELVDLSFSIAWVSSKMVIGWLYLMV